MGNENKSDSAPTLPHRVRAGRVERETFLLSLLVVFLVSCDTTPAYLREDIQERRLEKAGVTEVDPSGSTSSAGMSLFRDLDIRPLKTKRIGADTTSQGFHRYIHRCGTCHSAPDPAMRTASMWRHVFPRMKKHMREVGLIPLGPTDENLILEFLQRHAAER